MNAHRLEQERNMPVPFGNYMLDRWIAQGGMANIFTATYTGPLGFEREMVLKVILPEYAHHVGFIQMFLDEARLAARLSHPNIVQVLDLGQVGDYFYIAMEYVSGPSLSRALARARREARQMSPGLAVFIVAEVLEALSYAHQRRDAQQRPLGIVHRDVNPQNVLLSFDGQVKLTDFGVAKANVNLHESQSGVIKGKYSHMAPEQCLMKGVDGRADLFAVAIVLHELLTGKPLFSRSTAYEMMKAVMEEPIPAPSSVNPRCPPELDGIVLKGLQRNPDERYQNALAFLDGLNLVARRIQIQEGKHELRLWLSTMYHRARLNLAGNEEQGVVVTDEKVAEILRGHKGRQDRSESSDAGVSVTPSRSRIERRSEPTTASMKGRPGLLPVPVPEPVTPVASRASRGDEKRGDEKQGDEKRGDEKPSDEITNWWGLLDVEEDEITK